jgi:hypothetical protein
MLCAYCHRQLADNAESCVYCGAGERASATGGSPAGTATDPGQPLNAGLYRLHTFFFYLFLFVAIAVLVSAVALSRRGVFTGLLIGLLADLLIVGVAALHRYAARGARFGKHYGRAISFAFACLWLFGFPIGTILSIYVFTKISRSWEVGVEDEAPAVVPPLGIAER